MVLHFSTCCIVYGIIFLVYLIIQEEKREGETQKEIIKYINGN